MGKLIRFINQGIKHFFIVEGEPRDVFPIIAEAVCHVLIGEQIKLEKKEGK